MEVPGWLSLNIGARMDFQKQMCRVVVPEKRYKGGGPLVEGPGLWSLNRGARVVVPK